MDADIHRVEFLHLSSMSRGTLALLPLGKKKQQKVVVGDDTGVVRNKKKE
jgi:hypothetical protein